MDMLGEVLDLIPMLPNHFWVSPFIFRDELGDVVDLRVFSNARLDLPQTQRLVPVVPAILEVSTIFDFLLCGQVKDLLAKAELAVHLFLREAEVGYVKETSKLLVVA